MQTILKLCSNIFFRVLFGQVVGCGPALQENEYKKSRIRNAVVGVLANNLFYNMTKPVKFVISSKIKCCRRPFIFFRDRSKIPFWFAGVLMNIFDLLFSKPFSKTFFH